MTPSLDLPLGHLFRAADPAVKEPWLLLLLHGVGSNEKDLFALAPEVPANFHVLSLRAPHTLGPGAYAWFEFRVTAAGRVIDEAQEAVSRAMLAKVVAKAARQLGVPPDRVVTGGFSQGGIMSLSLLLTEPHLVRGAMVMHSRLLPEVVPRMAPAPDLRGKQLWLSHGTRDQVIPLAHAQAAAAFVKPLPINLSYAEYPSAHELTRQEISDAMRWLSTLAA